MTPRQTIIVAVLLGLLAFQILTFAILTFFSSLPDQGLSALNSSAYMILAPLSTVFLLGLLYAWLLRLGTRIARLRVARFDRFVRFLSEPFHGVISSMKAASLSDSARSLKILSRPRLVLAISLVVSSLLAYFPYRSDLNPTGSLVGVDSPLYVGWISQMLAQPLGQALQYSFVEGLEGSRPLLLLLLYSIASAGASPSQIIEYLPMILAPLLSLSTYVFVRYGQGSTHLAGLTSLFTPISFYTTVGLWGGYYANWLGLVFAFLFMTALLSFSKTPSRLNYGGMFFLSIALFLTHPWTWALVATVSLAFAISLWRETRNLIHLKSILAILLTAIALDFVKSWVFATRTVAADIATKSPSSFGSLLGFWNNLVQALLYTHGGLLGNWLILGIGLAAALALRFSDRFERLLIFWTAAASIPFATLDSYHQARIVYDLPVPILMSLAVIFFLPTIRARNLRWPGLIIAVILVTIIDYALQGILLL